MNLSTPLAWNEDVLLIPVGDLPDEMRAQIDCEEEDFALSRPQARTGSKILDAASADLVGRFREPCTLVEAVVLFGRTRGLDPNEILEGAVPLISGLLQSGFLVPAGPEDGPAEAAAGQEERSASPRPRGLAARYRPGGTVLGARVERILQVLEDTEVYLLRRAGGLSVLKLERRTRGGDRNGREVGLTARFEREATFLAHLGATGASGSGSGAAGSPGNGRIGVAPRLLSLGEVEERIYLEIEHIPGLDAFSAGAEWRSRGGAEGRRRLLDLCRAIASAYAGLQARGVLHGDVHPNNVRVDRDGSVRLIDFGLASAASPEPGLPVSAERGGIPFFYEPELARAYATGVRPPAATAAGEQYALAALLYLLVAGAHPRDYSLGREEMLREIAEGEPLPFRQRGARPWPALEAVLGKALSKRPEERFPNLPAFVAALCAIDAPEASDEGADAQRRATPDLDRLADGVLASASLDGPWLRAGIDRAPYASINYGAAGVALSLLQISLARGSGALLPLAELWTHRAARGLGEDEGFLNPAIEISREIVGESSPYHSPSGVHAVAALLARAGGDPYRQAAAIGRFLEACEKPCNGLDLTLGRAAHLLGAALLLDGVPETARPDAKRGSPLDPAPLLAFGDRAVEEIWSQLDAKPAIAEADVDYLGIAHGWAGFLYATLLWCEVAGRPVPSGVERRLVELANFALPAGRGLQWPWTLHGEGRNGAMPGWCNGTCGYVFLWTLAHRLLGRPEYLDLALGAGIESFDAADSFGSLCCGGAGRAYALLNLYRHTGDPVWIDRARELAQRCAQHGQTQEGYPHSLWKGDLGLAVLAVDLEHPETAAMPFFEPLGYRREERKRRHSLPA